MNTIDNCGSISLRIDVDAGAILRTDIKTIFGVFGRMVLFSQSNTGHPGAVVLDEVIRTPAYGPVIEGCPGTAIVSTIFNNPRVSWNKLYKPSDRKSGASICVFNTAFIYTVYGYFL